MILRTSASEGSQADGDRLVEPWSSGRHKPQFDPARPFGGTSSPSVASVNERSWAAASGSLDPRPIIRSTVSGGCDLARGPRCASCRLISARVPRSRAISPNASRSAARSIPCAVAADRDCLGHIALGVSGGKQQQRSGHDRAAATGGQPRHRIADRRGDHFQEAEFDRHVGHEAGDGRCDLPGLRRADRIRRAVADHEHTGPKRSSRRSTGDPRQQGEHAEEQGITDTANGRACEGCTPNRNEPRNGPTIRPSEANDWLTPSTSPCRAGSACFEIKADTDGFTAANPATATAAAA